MYPYSVAVESEYDCSKGVFVSPDVADFIGQRDQVLVCAQCLQKGAKNQGVSQREGLEKKIFYPPSIDTEAALFCELCKREGMKGRSDVSDPDLDRLVAKRAPGKTTRSYSNARHLSGRLEGGGLESGGRTTGKMNL